MNTLWLVLAPVIAVAALVTVVISAGVVIRIFRMHPKGTETQEWPWHGVFSEVAEPERMKGRTGYRPGARRRRRRG